MHQLFAIEVFNDTTLVVVFQESIVFFGCSFCERLEPVGAVGGSHLHSPFLHAGGHLVGYGKVKESAVLDDVAQFLIDVRR